MIRTIAMTVASTVLVTGCAAAARFPLEPGDVPSFDPASQGYIVGSLSFSGDYPEGERKPFLSRDNFRCRQYGFFYRPVDEHIKRFTGNVSTIPPDREHWTESDAYDFRVDEGLGYVFVMPLTAGRYEFYFYNCTCGLTTYYPADEIELGFEVDLGTVHYLGEVRFQHVFGRNIFDMVVPDGAFIQFRDEQQRDMALIRQKYPFLEALPVQGVSSSWDEEWDSLAGRE